MRGRKDVEILDALVLDQGLLERGLLSNDVDEVEHNPPLDAHDEVKIAQADIEVDDDGFVAGLRQAGGE